MGQRGPIPNHSDDLARPREATSGPSTPAITKGTALPYTWPETPASWCPIAKMAYDSLKVSGQREFYQQSDVALAYMLCENLDFYQSQTWASTGDRKRSPEMLKAILSGFTLLLMSEGDRRRVQIELAEPADEKPASLTVMADYREQLEQAGDPTPDEPEEGAE